MSGGLALYVNPGTYKPVHTPTMVPRGGGWMEPLPWVFVQRDKVITLIPDSPEIAVQDHTSFVDYDVI